MKQEGEGDVVLITGGSGFLGQHIVRLIEERDPTVKEIRIVDLRPYENRLRHSEHKKLVSILGDICDPASIEHAFEGVNCVFHCAAYINFQYPPNFDELERVNVKGTQNVIDLCIKHNVPNLIYTSSALVTFVPYMGKGTFSIIVNQTESKAKTPSTDSQFLIPGFPASKLRAEKLVLSSHGTKLINGKDHLNTVALRPTLMYGECDERFFPTIMRLAVRWNGKIPRIAEGGKKQLSYVGNVAWAHLCARTKLKMNPKDISGLPIFITDETPVTDAVRFTQRVNVDMEIFKIKPMSWSPPFLLCYFLAMMLELVLKAVNIFKKVQVEYCPRGLLAYGSSLVLFDRLRSSISMDYEPIYTVSEGFLRSAKWYDLWYQNFKTGEHSIRNRNS
ncbi:CLUMA_CG009602, isoform A [Clunio marinus]|uniref:CLUMA_CG009602, isoform A n=1 Tax=Clunio marinus TaxID=568069 RepID=A0A1J1I7B4_9DIPT|nr:CLUMA_CG009602, isoform A [Clunio marinus]